MAKTWGGAGAWAAEAERADLEKEEIGARPPSDLDFPDLSTAATQQRQKKKKPLPMSLGELHRGGYVFSQESPPLPRGPQNRTGEEPVAGALGGGFRDYGHRGGGGGMGRDRDFTGVTPFGGAFEREELGGFGRDRVWDDGPSRADEHASWNAGKNFVPSGRGSAYGDDDRRSSSRNSSRADGVDNWRAVNRPVPSAPASRGPGGGVSREPAGADADRWLKRERESVRESTDSRSAGDTGRSGPQRTPLKLNPPLGRTPLVDSSPPPLQVVQPDGSENKTPLTGEVLEQELPPKPKPKSNPFGAARPREEVLAEKGLDWRKLEVDRESTSRPSSSQGSRPQTPEVGTDGAARPRPKINPFGNAKPREVLLEEKGKDYRKIDFELEHRSVERSETAEEKKLKDEIHNLEELIKNSLQIGENGIITKDSIFTKEAEKGGESRASLQDQLVAKERELERVTRDLDDRVRFSQRGDRALRSGRPAGRSVSRDRSSVSRERVSVSRERS